MALHRQPVLLALRSPPGGNGQHRCFLPEGFPAVEFRLPVPGAGQYPGGGAGDGPSPGLAQIVDARPQELPADVRIVPHRQPRPIAVAVLAAQKGLLRKPAVVLGVQMLFVIVAHHVKPAEQPGLGGQLGKCRRQRHGAGIVLLPDDLLQLIRYGHQPHGVGLAWVILPLRRRFVGIVVACHRREGGVAVGVVGIVYLIADAPQDDAGVVPVPAHHGPQIGLVPDGEGLEIAFVDGRVDIVPGRPFVLGVLPFVKGLVHHKEAHPVAQVVELRHMGVVAAADGVAAALPQGLQTPLPDLRLHGRPQCAAVMVDADALQLGLHTVQEKASVRIERDSPDAHPGLVRQIERLLGKLLFRRTVSFCPIPCAQSVQVRVLRRPEPGPLQGSGQDAFPACAGHALHGQDSLPLRADQGRADSDEIIRSGQALRHIRPVAHHNPGPADSALRIRLVRLHLLRPEEHAVFRGMHRLLYDQRHLPGDAAAREPSGIRQIRMYHLHAEHVLLVAEGRRVGDVIGKGAVAVGALAQVIAVAPHLAVFIDAIKHHPQAFSPVAFRQPEMHPVPAGSPRQIACAAGIPLGKGLLHGPVVGHRDAAPAAVVEALVPGPGRRAAQVSLLPRASGMVVPGMLFFHFLLQMKFPVLP